MPIETNIYAEGARVLRACRHYAALTVAAQLVARLLGEAAGQGVILWVVSLLLWICLAYVAHVELLGFERGRVLDFRRLFGFALRAFILVVLAIAPGFALFHLLLFAAGSAPLTIIGLVGLVALLVVALCALVLCSGVGTLLPAYVADGQLGVGAALARGRRQFFWVAGRLLIGPGLVFGLSLALAYPLADVLGLMGELAALLADALRAYGTVMLAVVLTRALRRAEAAPAGAAAG